MIVDPHAWTPERQHQRPRQVPWRPFTAANAAPRPHEEFQQPQQMAVWETAQALILRSPLEKYRI
jgi:hypothetical protein